MKSYTVKILKNALVIFMAALMILLCGLEGADAAAPKPKKITVTPTKVTLTVGNTKTIKVKKVKPAKASKAVTYKSSNKKVATVSKKGKITAKKPGKAVITVTSKKNKKAKAKVTVTVVAKPQPQPEPAPSITKKSLVVFFSEGLNVNDPEKVYASKNGDFDALAGASILLDDSGQIAGDVGVLAYWIKEYLQTESYPIRVTDVANVGDTSLGYLDTDDPGNLYPHSQRDTQKYFRKYEQPQGINPPIAPMTAEDPDLSAYDVIFLGFPNWDGEPPHAVYTFLDENKDILDGKTIAVFAMGHYRRNAYAEAQLIIKAKLPKSTVIKSTFLRAQADLKEEARATTKAELIAWIKSIAGDINSSTAGSETEVIGQKELAMELVGQKLTASQIEEKVGKWTGKRVDTNGCNHNVSSMRFYYNGFVIYTRPVGIDGADIEMIQSEITEDTLFEVLQIS